MSLANIIATQKKSENREQMRRDITKVLEDGGEGLVLRQPLSVYQPGRSLSILKFKASRDAEALVVHDLGLGWFLLQLPNRVQFEAKENQNKFIYGDKIKKGEVVTFSYDAYGKEGIPKNAKIVRKRPEVSWMNVVYNFSKERHAKSLNNVTISSLSETTTRNPQGYWTDAQNEGKEKENNNNEISNLRKFFMDIAKERKMDPLLPENWYSLRNREIRQYKGASAVLFHFQSSLSKALLEAFPEIGLKIEDFHRHSFKYWNNVENRKKFFDTFAKEKRFDPLKPQNWQSVTINQIHKTRGGTSVLSYYEGSLQKALLDIYPSFNIQGSLSQKDFAWRSLAKRKQFLDNFADKRGFDPLVPANWCSILSKDLLSEENARSFLARYKNSLYNAIMDVYPSIGISNHLQRNPKNFFANKENRKQFFDNIALKLQFDPQQMKNWFPIGNYRIAQEKGGATVMGYYSHSLQNALSDIYGFDYPNPDELQEYKTARYFFDSFAKRHSFDPLEPKNWYNLLQKPSPKVQEHLSAKFGFSIANTLSSVYPNVSFNVSFSEKKRQKYVK